eukprot:3701612-Amphidinium_carterae.1
MQFGARLNTADASTDKVTPATRSMETSLASKPKAPSVSYTKAVVSWAAKKIVTKAAAPSMGTPMPLHVTNVAPNMPP